MKTSHRYLIIIFCLFAAFIAINSDAYFMVIDIIQDRAGSVFFPHHRHLASPDEGGAKLDCIKCHHELAENDSQKKTPSLCTSTKCHPIDKKSAEETGIRYIKKAFHDLCKKCHKKSRTKTVKPPVKCSGCHKKELIPFSKKRKEENLSE